MLGWGLGSLTIPEKKLLKIEFLKFPPATNLEPIAGVAEATATAGSTANNETNVIAKQLFAELQQIENIPKAQYDVISDSLYLASKAFFLPTRLLAGEVVRLLRVELLYGYRPRDPAEQVRFQTKASTDGAFQMFLITCKLSLKILGHTLGNLGNRPYGNKVQTEDLFSEEDWENRQTIYRIATYYMRMNENLDNADSHIGMGFQEDKKKARKRKKKRRRRKRMDMAVGSIMGISFLVALCVTFTLLVMVSNLSFLLNKEANAAKALAEKTGKRNCSWQRKGSISRRRTEEEGSPWIPAGWEGELVPGHNSLTNQCPHSPHLSCYYPQCTMLFDSPVRFGYQLHFHLPVVLSNHTRAYLFVSVYSIPSPLYQ